MIHYIDGDDTVWEQQPTARLDREGNVSAFVHRGSYQMSAPDAPELARGIRWDDPAFGIVWPWTDRQLVSERDQGFWDFYHD